MGFTLNGVSPTDHLAFLREVKNVVERDYDRVFVALEEQVALDEPVSCYEGNTEPFAEPVSWRTRVRYVEDARAYWRKPADDRWHDYRRGRDRFRSKRKEVK